MMSYRDLLRAPHAILHPVPGAPYPSPAEIRRAVITDTQWRLPADSGADVLAILPEGEGLPAERIERALADLAGQGAGGVVLPGELEAWPVEEIRRAAHAADLALLTAPAGQAAQEIRTHVTDLRSDVTDIQNERIGHVARLARQMETGQEPADPAELARWLARQLGTGCDAVLSAPTDPRPDLLPDTAQIREEYTAIQAGRPAAGHILAADASEPHVLLCPVGDGPPYGVLTAISADPFSPHAVFLAEQTAGHITAVQLTTTRQQSRNTTHALRSAIVQQALAGDISGALRASSQMPAGGRFRGEAGRMAVIECTSTEVREIAVSKAEEATGGEAVVATCPAFNTHVLALMPEGIAPNDRAARSMLARVVDPEIVKAVGISTRSPYPALPRSYGAARRALGPARTDPDRVAVRSSGTALADILPPEPYAVWAQRITAPLASIPAEQRHIWIQTTEIFLTSGRTAACALLRETERSVRRRVTTVMSAMGLDYHHVADRALAQLALAAAPAEPGTVPGSAPSLEQLFSGPTTKKWAERTLNPLSALGHEEEEQARKLLAVWLKCDTIMSRTAAETGRSRTHLPDTIKRIGEMLSLGLKEKESGGDAHEVLWPLVILKYLTVSEPA